MQNIQQAIAAGRSAPINDEAPIPGREWGLKGNTLQRSDSSDARRLVQSVEDIDNAFNRLVRQFQAFGLGLYPLSGDALLCSSPLGMSRTLPDLRSAKMYLRQIGGAT